MKSIILPVILLFSFFMMSCSPANNLINQKPSAISWESLQIKPKTDSALCAPMQPGDIDTFANIKQTFPSSGLAVGFLPEDLSIPNQIANDTFWVNSNEQLTFDWFFWYPEGNETSANLRLFVLLDEHQLDNALPQPGLYNDINLERGDDLSIKVKIPPLEVGVHDLIAAGIPYPENKPDVYGIVKVVYRRISLIVEPAPSAFRKIAFSSIPAEGIIKNGDPLLTLELTVKRDGIDIWNWPDPWLHIYTNAPTRFYALAGHQDVVNQDAPSLDPLEESFFAILLFVDYQQIEVAPNQIAFYYKVNKDNAYGRIPFEVPSLPKGKHRILVLRIDTPGVPYCILRGNTQERILPFGIHGKLVGLEIRSK